MKVLEFLFNSEVLLRKEEKVSITKNHQVTSLAKMRKFSKVNSH